jgi:hypothetical protein
MRGSTVAQELATSPPASTLRGASVLPRLGEVLRDIARGGLAGAVAGLIVGGFGGRIIMRIAAIVSPDARGFRTENGELIGAITANGTFALLLFGGLASGVVAGIVWVVVSPWIPASGWRRWLLAMPVTVALGGFVLVRSDNFDFAVLDSDALIVGLLLVLVALIGATIAWLDEHLDRKLPRPRTKGVFGYGLIAMLGALVLPFAIGLYMTGEGCDCASPPERTGWALIAVGAATTSWWAIRIGTGRQDPPAALLVIGRVALLAASVLGLAHLVPQVMTILASE